MEQQHSHDAGERDHSGEHRTAPDKESAAQYAHIKGWGADLDIENRPAYPMERTPPRLEGVRWTRPEDQPLNMKVYHSVERPGITPIFGTSAPPAGLSGKIRDMAYTISENDIRHWLLLMLADRVNVVEGIGSDLMRGKIPNVLAEMGIRAEWKHNKAGLARKVAIASLVAGTAYLLLRRKEEPVD
jgi:hypothetical protein